MILHCLEVVLSRPKYQPLVSWEILRVFKNNVEKTPVFLWTRLRSTVGGRRRCRSSVLHCALAIELKSQIKIMSKFWNEATKIVLTQINKASLHWGTLLCLRLGQGQHKWPVSVASYGIKLTKTTPNHSQLGKPSKLWGNTCYDPVSVSILAACTSRQNMAATWASSTLIYNVIAAILKRGV